MIKSEEKQDLQIVLRLDTIYGLFSFWERMRVRGYMQGYRWAVLPDKARLLLHFVEDTDCNPPILKVGQDRLVYVEDMLLEDYATQTADIGRKLKQLIR